MWRAREGASCAANHRGWSCTHCRAGATQTRGGAHGPRRPHAVARTRPMRRGASRHPLTTASCGRTAVVPQSGRERAGSRACMPTGYVRLWPRGRMHAAGVHSGSARRPLFLVRSLGRATTRSLRRRRIRRRRKNACEVCAARQGGRGRTRCCAVRGCCGVDAWPLRVNQRLPTLRQWREKRPRERSSTGP